MYKETCVQCNLLSWNKAQFPIKGEFSQCTIINMQFWEIPVGMFVTVIPFMYNILVCNSKKMYTTEYIVHYAGKIVHNEKQFER